MSHRHQTAPRSWAALFLLLLSYTTGFSSPYQTRKQQSSSLKAILDRRSWLTTTMASSAALLNPLMVVGAEEGEEISTEATAVLLPAVEMRKFVDPVGYFEIVVPKRFFAIRRNNKGDLPDASTGQGRRGSSIFSAGDFSKAEVVAVERFPTRVLLEENGIEPSGSLDTFPKLGEPGAIANLINLRRIKDKPGEATVTQILEPRYSEDGKNLMFQMRTEVQAQKPELLMETYGVDRLFRITEAKASLESNDGYLMAVFASALETDFKGPDGVALQDAVKSFTATEQTPKP